MEHPDSSSPGTPGDTLVRSGGQTPDTFCAKQVLFGAVRDEALTRSERASPLEWYIR